MSELVATKTNLPTERPKNMAWGAENVSKKDVIIPRILMMQGLSEFVGQGKAAIGDIVDAMTCEKLGSRQKPVRFIPFYLAKHWKVEKEVTGQKRLAFVENVPMTPLNEDLELEYFEKDPESGKDVRHERTRVISVFVLLPAQLEAGTNKIPYLLEFKSTSYNAGKKLSSFFTRLADFNLPPAARVFELSVFDKENKDGKFIVADISMLEGETKAEYQDLAYDWYTKVQKGAVKVSDDDATIAKDITPKANTKPNPDGKLRF